MCHQRGWTGYLMTVGLKYGTGQVQDSSLVEVLSVSKALIGLGMDEASMLIVLYDLYVIDAVMHVA